jgi:hypothetical protein
MATLARIFEKHLDPPFNTGLKGHPPTYPLHEFDQQAALDVEGQGQLESSGQIHDNNALLRRSVTSHAVLLAHKDSEGPK